MLTTITDNPLFANVEMVRNVVASAQAVVNRVFARGLQEPANQIILNTLSADDRYLEAAQAFSGQLEIFNNALDMIGKQWK